MPNNIRCQAIVRLETEISKVRHKVIPASFIVFRRGNKVLLLKRANTSYHQGDYSIPAGHVGGVDESGGESALNAAIREAKEEIGVDIDPKDLRLIHVEHRLEEEPEPGERIDLYFEAEKWQGKITNVEPEKCSELRWALIHDLPSNTIPEVRQALEMIAKNEQYSDFGF